MTDDPARAPSAPELPMAVVGCGLDPAALHAQAERYRRLGAAAAAIEHQGDRVQVVFAPDVDPGLLEGTIATERACCPSLAVDYDPRARRLTITAAGAEGQAALQAIVAALGRQAA